MSDLVIRDLNLTLNGRAILRDVDVTLRSGRVTAILGPNGAGKSSLLACLTGERTPDSGRLAIGDRPLASLDARSRARIIGFLAQDAQVHWDIDVATLVGLGRLPHRGRWGESVADRDAIAAAMTATDCTALAASRVQHLSGGERARVLLARVLAGEPQWLLADEPLASLDPAHQIATLDLIRQTARNGTGVAVVLHDLTQAARVADDVVILKQGSLVAAGPRDSVLTASILADAFDIAVHIGQDDRGAPLIVPMARR